MTDTSDPMFAARGSTRDIETGSTFQPKFDSDGLIPAIVVDTETGDVLMFAHMNGEALRLTMTSGFAHFWSRSRKRLWKKGEESGNTLAVADILTDCDQDVVLIKARVAGNGPACHTGARSCFYRRVDAAADEKPARLSPFANAKSHSR